MHISRKFFLQHMFTAGDAMIFAAQLGNYY